MSKVRLKSCYWSMINDAVDDKIERLQWEFQEFNTSLRKNQRIKDFLSRYGIVESCSYDYPLFYDKVIGEKYEAVKADEEKARERSYLRKLYAFIHPLAENYEALKKQLDTLARLRNVLENASLKSDTVLDVDLDSIFFNDGSVYDGSDDGPRDTLV